MRLFLIGRPIQSRRASTVNELLPIVDNNSVKDKPCENSATYCDPAKRESAPSPSGPSAEYPPSTINSVPVMKEESTPLR
jgi:hypothetical protein